MISIKKIVYGFIIVSLFIDVFNGIIFRYTNGFSISLIYKGLYFVLILIFCLNKGYLSKTSLFSFLLFVPITYHLISYKFNITELQWVLRFITLSLTLDFLIANPDENKVNSYFKITYLILIFSALSWLIFGFGYSQYSIDNVGTRGFFLAGNELGIIHIITTFYFLRKYLNK